MPKLSKVFLALIIALLVTAVAETLFIFVYKSPQTIPLPQAVVTSASPTPSPGKTAISSTFLSNVGAWQAYPNQHTTLTNDITGTIESIKHPEKTSAQTSQGSAADQFTYIRFVGTGYVGYRFTEQQWNSSKVFDTRNGGATPIKISDLAPGDNIDISEIFNAGTSDGSSPNSIIIYRTK